MVEVLHDRVEMKVLILVLCEVFCAVVGKWSVNLNCFFAATIFIIIILLCCIVVVTLLSFSFSPFFFL